MHSQADDRDGVLTTLNRGDAARAVVLARKLLLSDPQNADLLGLLGIALEANGDKDAAADALRRSLSSQSSIAIYLRNFANLAAVLLEAGKRDDAAEVIRESWRTPESVVQGSKESQCLAFLAEIMTALGLYSELAARLLPVVRGSELEWSTVKCVALALANLGRSEEALHLVEPDVSADHAHERHAVLARLYAAAGRVAEANVARKVFIAGAPAYLSAATSKHYLIVGFINTAPPAERLPRTEYGVHFHSNYPAQMVKKLGDRYRWVSVLAGSGSRAIETVKTLGPGVVINNNVNAESLRAAQNLLEANKLADQIGSPIINHPRQAAECTRQDNSTRFLGISNVIVPRVSRFVRDVTRLGQLIAQIESAFPYPLIVRTPGEQEATNLFKIDHRGALKETLLKLTQPQIYVIEYAGGTRRKGCYRRLRAAFVEGDPTIMRADYDADWIVQGRKRVSRQAFYRHHPDLLMDADDIVRNPHSRLSMPVWEALKAIGQTMPLDVFGMDFDVDDEGRIVFFEANATMNLFSTAPAGFDYPPLADEGLLQQLEQLLLRRSGRTQRARENTLH